jgi:saccharopine dehydrogenase-like NADP-dependent oxidoreductase
MVRLLARGLWDEPGVAPPEIVGRNQTCFDSVLKHLEERDVHIFQRVDEI